MKNMRASTFFATVCCTVLLLFYYYYYYYYCYASNVSLGTYAQPSGSVLFALCASSSLIKAVAGARLPFLDARTEPRVPRLAPRA